MNILFLTLVGFNSIYDNGIYPDLMRELARRGHSVYVISPVERREGVRTHVITEEVESTPVTILRLRIGNTQKTNIIEKGISTVLIEAQFKTAIKRYMGNVTFDLILYSTPPITLVGAIEYVKRRDNARTYLLLKDIFPQNAVDIGMMTTSGIKGFLHTHFRGQEHRLYAVSDRIGCMSMANVDYILKHNADVRRRHEDSIRTTGKPIVEVCPNSIEVSDHSIDEKMRESIRRKYDIPLDKKVFVYGGNLGKPQGVAHIIKCLRYCRKMQDVYFLIVGDGTEYGKLERYMNHYEQSNVKLMRGLPKGEYDILVASCDVGMIFLDYRFTIPNFPSRLLSYMQAKLPVLACTDECTDIGNVITGIDKSGTRTHAPFGWWCPSNDVKKFAKCVREATKPSSLGEQAYAYLKEHYDVRDAVDVILSEAKDT